jgi:histidinol-phosphate aminotransferase
MKFVNKYLRNLQPYKVASHKIWEVPVNEQCEVLKLDWNEATIPPSPKVKEALFELVNNDHIFNLYPSTNNNTLLSLLSQYTQLSESNLQYFASSDSLHEYLVRMYVAAGDPILILGPTYDNFRLTCESQGGQVNYFYYPDNFQLNDKDFIDKIFEIKPSLIYICNPNNPSGNLISEKVILNILKIFKDTVILLDEAYFEFSKFTMSKHINDFENLFISRTFSKAFALANFRAGYLISHPSNILEVSKIRNSKNFGTFTQVAVVAALSDIDYMQSYVEQVIEAREFFCNYLDNLFFVNSYINSNANFVLVKFKNNNYKNIVINKLEDNYIFVRELQHSILLENCLRFTIGNISQMKRVIKVLNEIK